MILSGHHGIRAVGTTSFEVLVSPPLPSLVGRAINCCSRLSKIPSGTEAQVEASHCNYWLLTPKCFGSNLFPRHCNHLCGMKCKRKDRLIDEQNLSYRGLPRAGSEGNKA
jgi:hypothetical protein